MEMFQSQRTRDYSSAKLAKVLLVLAFVQILLGALVAGIDAGRGYIDWPMMGGEFLPSESFDYTPMWTNFFENPALVQFNHRMLGYIVMLVGIFSWFKTSLVKFTSSRDRWFLRDQVFIQPTICKGTIRQYSLFHFRSNKLIILPKVCLKCTPHQIALDI